MDQPRCETRMWFKPLQDFAPIGKCDKANSMYSLSMADNMVMPPSGTCYVGPRFGCIHHENEDAK